jgi:hypothetical protein
MGERIQRSVQMTHYEWLMGEGRVSDDTGGALADGVGVVFIQMHAIHWPRCFHISQIADFEDRLLS